MQQFSGTMLVNQALLNEMDLACQEAYSGQDKKGTRFDREFVFDDGNRMAIQVVNAMEEPCWTQGVLFDPEGQELGCTDVGDSLSGEFAIELTDSCYTLIVRPE